MISPASLKNYKFQAFSKTSAYLRNPEESPMGVSSGVK
jgi:hypothetical protein